MFGIQGFKKWAERVHGMHIKQFHLDWINALLTKKRVGIYAPTGFGKSTLFAIAFPLWMMWYKKKLQFLITSTSLPQATDLLKRTKIHIMDNELLKELVPDVKSQVWSKTELSTVTNCHMFCKPNSENIKGYHVDYVLADEAASYKDWDVFFKYVVTRAASKKGIVACISTPEHDNDMMAAKIRDNSEWFFETYSALVNDKGEPDLDGESIWPERFSTEWLNGKRREIGEAAFALQYQCDTKVNLDDPDKQPFPFRDMVANSYPKLRFETTSIPGAIYYATYDPAFSITGDYQAIAVGRRTSKLMGDEVDNKIKVCGLYRFKSDPDEARERLRAIYHIFHPVKIAVDTSSGGVYLMQKLLAAHLPCVDFPFKHENRMAGFRATIGELSKRGVIIPCSDKDMETKHKTEVLYNEMTHYVRSKTPSGLSTYKSTTKNDDLSIAFIMLIKTISEEQPFMSYFRTGTKLEATTRKQVKTNRPKVIRFKYET